MKKYIALLLLFAAPAFGVPVSPNNPAFVEYTLGYNPSGDTYVRVSAAPAFNSIDPLSTGDAIRATLYNDADVVIGSTSYTYNGTADVNGCNCLNMELYTQQATQVMRVAFMVDSGSVDLDDVMIEVKSGDQSWAGSGTPYSPPAISDGIVYSRVPAAYAPTVLNIGNADPAVPYDSWQADVWDSLPDVFNQTNNFNGLGQLVHRQSNGNETVIEDCFTGNLPCLPMDATVSLDGKRIVYAVVSSGSFDQRTVAKTLMPTFLLKKDQRTEAAQIKVWDIETGAKLEWPTCTPAPCHDLSPIWLQDGKVMFMTNRDKQVRVNIRPGTNPSQYHFRPYIADADGSNAYPVGPHVMSGALHPILLNDGWVAIGEMWDFHNLAYHRSNGSPGGHDTRDNQWIVVKVNRDYGDAQALLGAHHMSYQGYAYPLLTKNEKKTKALHFLGQRANNDICTLNYYRRNNDGLGDLVCWPQQPNMLEGDPNNGFLPWNYYQVAQWTHFGDQRSYLDNDGLLTGKFGWPEGTDDNQMMVTMGRGLCTDNGYVPTDLEYMKDPFQYGCKTGIYKTTVIPSTHPNDMQVVVDTLEWHEFNARVVKSRTVPSPAIADTGDGSCQLISTNAKVTDSHSQTTPFVFNKQQEAMANDGSELYYIPQETVAGIRLTQVEQETVHRPQDDELPIDGSYDKDEFVQTYIGHRSVKVLDDIDLLPDGSFKAQVPCNTPFTMSGIDSDGLIIKRDQIPMSLRPGEVRLCEGCHLHGERGRPYEESDAFTAVAQILKTVPDQQMEWVKDIGPIVASKCTTCHNTGSPNGVFRNDMTTYNRLAIDNFQTLVDPQSLRFNINAWDEDSTTVSYGLERPYASKYINNMFAAASLFYWKAAGKRTDYNTDPQYDDDIDFGASHAKHVTDVELKKIRDWIETGAAYEAYNDAVVADFEMLNPTPISGTCTTWEQAKLRQHTSNCMFRFTMRLQPGELEPYTEPTEWPINIVVPPNTGELVGIDLAYHGGSGTTPNTSTGTDGNFGIRPVDTRDQPGANACTGITQLKASWLGYGWFNDGRPAQKYVQRRIKRAIDWLQGEFPGQVTLNTVQASGSSMAHSGAAALALSDYNILTHASGNDGVLSFLYRDAYWDATNGGADTMCGKGPGPNDTPGYNQEYIDSVDMNWWIANSDYYKYGWCGDHGWGRTDEANADWLATKDTINNFAANRMCQRAYLGAGYFYTGGGQEHSPNDGCFRWGTIVPTAMQFSLDHPALSFSNSTGDYPSTPPWDDTVGRGHVNFGLDWNSSGVIETASSLTMPVRYDAKTFETRSPYTLGEDATSCQEVGGLQTVMPPMASSITADVMLMRPTSEPSRHPNFVSKFWPTAGQSVTLTYGAYSDTQTADANGRVVFANVPFTSGTYVNMVFTK